MEEINLKNGLKTLAMWLIIGVIFTVLLNAVFNNADTKMTYSELLTSIAEEKVKKIEISADGDMAYVILNEESKTW